MDKLKEYLLRHKAELDVDAPASGGWESIASKMSERSGYFSWVRYAVAACVIVVAGVGFWMVTRNNGTPADVVKQDSGTRKGGPARGGGKIGDSLEKEEKGARAGEVGRGAKEPERGTRGLERGEGGLARGAGGPEQGTGGLVRGGGKEKKQHKAGPPKPMETSDAVANIDKSYSTLIDYQLRKLRATPLYAENGSYFSFYVEQLKQMDQDERAARKDIKTYGLTSEFLEQLINVYQQKLNILKDLQTEINKMNNKVRGKQGPSGNTEVHYLDI